MRFGPLSKVLDQITKAGAKQSNYESCRSEILNGFPDPAKALSGNFRHRLSSE
ncbi:hypothetical protein CEV32_0018 [Brucella rhizosphaerae]|uniref:Uncharacterized protein n=1 Tax=Brucella rhizosphaerae TaxID=571254 RepID=A0A256FH94_9HYPH|nr:hypothetical protein CEV32_0018 [Brucella rhizosphaerae]